MRVPSASTQPDASKLVSYDGFLRRLTALEKSRRVKIQKVGQSHGGRGIYCIVVAGEDAIPQLERFRSALTGFLNPPQSMKESVHSHNPSAPDPSETTRFSALLMGLSFGHEASHVEGLLELAERLAWSEDEETRAILRSLIVLLMPMANPDGRMAAIETWKRYPFAADGSAGNLKGFLLNRDFLHLTQPESKAILAVCKEWAPVALLDTHEDVYLLGVTVPEVCWCPAFGQSTVRDAPDAIRGVVRLLGLDIAAEWKRRGFESYQQDMFMWTGSSSADEVEWLFGMDGNVAQTMSVHGVPAVMTESARTPGTQSWEDRIQQKVYAGLAFLRAVAKDALAIAQAVRSSRQAVAERASRLHGSFLIPKWQRDRSAVAQLVDTLLKHGVQIFEVGEPYEAFLVPLGQNGAGVAIELLSVDESKIHAMPPALGVSVVSQDQLPASERAALENAQRQLVVEPPMPVIRIHAQDADVRYSVSNTPHGVKFANRALASGYAVLWVLESSAATGRQVEAGSFVVALPSQALPFLSRGLDLDIYGIASDFPLVSYELRPPRIAVYTGQGADGLYVSARADLLWALERMEFPFTPYQAQEIDASNLGRIDVLLVPSGNADEIVSGWSKDSLLHKPPWQVPGEPRGIGKKGLETIRAFVDNGGTYFGVDGGGGLLALPDFANLLDLEVVAHSLGLARVVLRVEDRSNPVMFGLNGYYDRSGNWQEGFFPALYYTELFGKVPGGLVFRPKNDARVLASYHAVDFKAESRQFRRASLLTVKGEAAVAFRRVHRGQVIVTGVHPGFRAAWSNTWKLVSNAIFSSVLPRT